MLGKLKADLSDYDAMDRLEILCAWPYYDRPDVKQVPCENPRNATFVSDLKCATLRVLGMTVEQ